MLTQVLLALATLVPTTAETEFEWKGRKAKLAEPPEGIAATALRRVADWEGFAAEEGYKMVLSEDQRVLLVAPKKKRTKQELRLVDEVLELTDEHFPLPASRQDLVDPPVSSVEDVGLQRRPPLESDTAVLLVLQNSGDLGAACRILGERDEHLAPWSKSAARGAGFVLSQPLIGAYLLNLDGNEEWSPDNELVNRLTRLLLTRRFGRSPHWLEQGVAWFAEMELKGGVYCFPGRDSFVGVGEHGSWDKALRAQFKKSKSPVRMDALCALERNRFETNAAHRAFGVVSFLTRHHPGGISEVLERLRALREEGEVIEHPDGSWTLVAGYEPEPPEQQLAFEDVVGADFLAELTEFFKKGKRYKPARR